MAASSGCASPARPSSTLAPSLIEAAAGGGTTPSLIEFPADDPERARRFWSGLLDAELEPRVEAKARAGRRTRAPSRSGSTRAGAGRATPFSLPYFAVPDVAAALERVEALGGSVVHPGETWAICKDSEGSPFGLARG